MKKDIREIQIFKYKELEDHLLIILNSPLVTSYISKESNLHLLTGIDSS